MKPTKKIVALYDFGNGCLHASDFYGEDDARYHTYPRVTEPVEITFPPLSDEVVIANQIAFIDAAELELRNRFQEKLNEFNEQRAKLRALTHVEAA